MDVASISHDQKLLIHVAPTVHLLEVETTHIEMTAQIDMTRLAANATIVVFRPTARTATAQHVDKRATNVAKQATSLEPVGLASRGSVNRAPHRIVNLIITNKAVSNSLPQSVSMTANVSSDTSNFKLAIAFKSF